MFSVDITLIHLEILPLSLKNVSIDIRKVCGICPGATLPTFGAKGEKMIKLLFCRLKDRALGVRKPGAHVLII
jgi:hypothetical protein